MNIGKLNRRVSILEFVKYKDEFGGEQGKWVNVKDVWATVKITSGTEFFGGQQVNAESGLTIYIRYNPEINVLNRIKYFDNTYEIIGVFDDYLGHKMSVLNCKELVSDGLQCKAEKSKSQH